MHAGHPHRPVAAQALEVAREQLQRAADVAARAGQGLVVVAHVVAQRAQARDGAAGEPAAPRAQEIGGRQPMGGFDLRHAHRLRGRGLDVVAEEDEGRRQRGPGLDVVGDGEGDVAGLHHGAAHGVVLGEREIARGAHARDERARKRPTAAAIASEARPRP